MKVKVFAIHDSKASAYQMPFFMPNKGLATRGFSDLALDVKSAINKHPADYTLYCIGEFDDESGSLVGLKAPEFVARGSDFVVDQKV